MIVLKTLIGLLVLIVSAVLVLIYSGIYNIAADDRHFEVVRWVLTTAKRNSVARHAQDIVTPSDLGTDTRIHNGAKLYSQMCVQCHLAPGVDATALHKGLKPMPPNFAASPPNFTSKQMFWIVKHGYKMTGMPAWGLTHSDEQIWDIVAFLPKLANMSAAEYAQHVISASNAHQQGTPDSI